MKPFAAPEDLTGFDPDRDLAFPGQYPFTRGIQPTMYRGRLWTMRQYAGFGTAAESNRRYRYLLSQGVSGLSVAFDLPTQIGYDSDHQLASGEVGRVGVAIDSIDDMPSVVRAWINDKNGQLLRAEVKTFTSFEAKTADNSITVEFDQHKELGHVLEAVDRDADSSDFSLGKRMVRVVAHLGRQVEGDAEACDAL